MRTGRHWQSELGLKRAGEVAGDGAEVQSGLAGLGMVHLHKLPVLCQKHLCLNLGASTSQ